MTPERVRPMLAKTYHPRYWTLGGMCVQPKLNGIRMMAQGQNLMSRDGLLWKPGILAHIRSALAALPPDVIFDGELYCHGMSLQEINSRIAVVRQSPHPDEAAISYHIFDFVSLSPFMERAQTLNMFHVPSTSIQFVETFFAPRYEEAHRRFLRYQELRYEGAMFRDPLAPYSLPSVCSNKENRSRALLKKKDWEDMDCTILEVLPGEGQFETTCGSLRFETPDGVSFTAGSGLDTLQRHKLWELRYDIERLALTAKIKYEMLSDNGTPLKPTILLIPALP